MPKAVLWTRSSALTDVILVPENFDAGNDTSYIAVRTLPDVEPALPWTVSLAQRSSDIKDGILEVHPFSLGPIYSKSIDVEYMHVKPPALTRVILSAPGPIYDTLATQPDVIRLPEGLLRQGSLVVDSQCIVKACEPVDQGLVTASTAVAVVRGPAACDNLPRHTDFVSDFLDQSQYLKKEKSLQVTLKPLDKPVSGGLVRPLADDHEDLENSALLRIDQLAHLGIFSGDSIVLSSNSKSRVIKVYAYPEPEPSWVGTELFVPPLLIFNLGCPKDVTLRCATLEEAQLPEAGDVVLSRIASPVATNRAYQSAFLGGLRQYFSGKSRVVKGGDVIGVPIDTLLARSFAPDDIPEGSEAKYDAIVWFRIEGDFTESVFNPLRSRMVQSGTTQAPAPSSALGWHRYYGLVPPFPYITNNALKPSNFRYAVELHDLLKASLTPRGITLGASVLLTSSRRGAGKRTVLQSVASQLGIHILELECYNLVGDGDAKVLGALAARLDRASAPAVILLRHIEAIASVGDQDGRDGPITSGLVAALDDAIAKPGVVLTATAADPDKLSDSVRSRFKFEVDVSVPTEPERLDILDYLSRPETEILTARIPNLVEGIIFRGDVSLASLALQSAGLTPPDLVAIVKGARHAALKEFYQNEDQLAYSICQRAILKITPQHVEDSVNEAREKYSDSIGAPKIPKVGWKDVGGLEAVKGEIMDTIDMPLKYPQLFASGVKKRSGILFYGPPGTGKTLLAKAIATTFSLNFLSVKGPELLNMYIGESEANVRRVFQKARDAKPCVVFFDELDSVAPKRGNQGDSGGVMDRIVSQLLAELDGMSQGADGVFVIGATNRPDLLDEALLRPGRFDKMLYLGVSDTHEKQRTILEALTRKFDLGDDVDLDLVANMCPFTYTGADFYAMSSDAMLNAMTRTASAVDTKIAMYNENHPDAPLSTRAWFEHQASPEDVHVKVTAADFAKAQQELIPSVSADELAHYQRVRATFESSAGSETNGSNGANGANGMNGSTGLNGPNGSNRSNGPNGTISNGSSPNNHNGSGSNGSSVAAINGHAGPSPAFPNDNSAASDHIE